MPTEESYLLEELVPHAHPMILIDAVSEPESGELEATVRISEDCPFFEARLGVPTYVGIEYVAQTVAALAGLRARRSGTEIKLGFLLGARRLHAAKPYFSLGSVLSVRVYPEYEAAEFAKYRGEISDDSGEVLVSTAVTVYSGLRARGREIPGTAK